MKTKKTAYFSLLVTLFGAPAYADVVFSKGSLVLDGKVTQGRVSSNAANKTITLNLTLTTQSALDPPKSQDYTYTISEHKLRNHLLEDRFWGPNFTQTEVDQLMEQINSKELDYNYPDLPIGGLASIVEETMSYTKDSGKESDE